MTSSVSDLRLPDLESPVLAWLLKGLPCSSVAFLRSNERHDEVELRNSAAKTNAAPYPVFFSEGSKTVDEDWGQSSRLSQQFFVRWDSNSNHFEMLPRADNYEGAHHAINTFLTQSISENFRSSFENSGAKSSSCSRLELQPSGCTTALCSLCHDLPHQYPYFYGLLQILTGTSGALIRASSSRPLPAGTSRPSAHACVGGHFLQACRGTP